MLWPWPDRWPQNSQICCVSASKGLACVISVPGISCLDLYLKVHWYKNGWYNDTYTIQYTWQHFHNDRNSLWYCYSVLAFITIGRLIYLPFTFTCMIKRLYLLWILKLQAYSTWIVQFTSRDRVCVRFYANMEWHFTQDKPMILSFIIENLGLVIYRRCTLFNTLEQINCFVQQKYSVYILFLQCNYYKRVQCINNTKLVLHETQEDCLHL